LRLLPYAQASHPSGTIYFDNVETLGATSDQIQSLRGNKVGMIFQEPMTAFNPLHTIEKQINEVLLLHKGLSESQASRRTRELLEVVGIENADQRMRAYPHDFSGGQRQRIAIARALVLKPKLLILGKPTSSLDRSVQFQVINLLKDLQMKYGLTYLFITHDLKTISDHQQSWGYEAGPSKGPGSRSAGGR
jgi:microcin C transport system ATP-binding protein